jgi:5'-nucleotidase
MSSRPLVLLSNDDGYQSHGIRTLRAALQEVADVVVVAPQAEQSAASHALSLHRPLRMQEIEKGVFSVDGTPADSVYSALHSVGRAIGRLPDVVVSGLNHGLNLGQDVFYSGTVAAAREGALRGIPALAASAHPKADFVAAARVAARIAVSLAGRGPGPDAGAFVRIGPEGPAPLLNLNFPREWKGVRATRLGTRFYEQGIEFRTDPRGREYFWIGGAGVSHDEDPGSDTHAYDEGWASLTPLVLDLTGYALIGLAEELVKGGS